MPLLALHNAYLKGSQIAILYYQQSNFLINAEIAFERTSAGISPGFNSPNVE